MTTAIKGVEKPRKLRVVVSKDAEKTRQNKSGSYNLTDQYDVDLLNYAEDPVHGNYSEFSKRAIAFYRDFHSVRQTEVMPAPRTSLAEVVEEADDDLSTKGFL